MNTEPMTFNYITATDNQILRHEAAEQANNIATGLEALAARIRSAANGFNGEERSAAAIVADIVSDYTQATGLIAGSRFWSLIRELSRMR